MGIKETINDLKKEMKLAAIFPENGLGTELFLFSSTLAPVVNVDLVVFNEAAQVLLIWRDDPHTGTGWHIPGGCIRLKETIEDRIMTTAIQEIGAKVECLPGPAVVYEIFNTEHRDGVEDQNERSHFITLSYICRLKECIPIEKNIKWFDSLPDDLLKCQDCYRHDWDNIKNNALRWHK